MKNYKVTKRGKTFLIVYFIAMITSYFLVPLFLYFLSGIFLILLIVEVADRLLNYQKDTLIQKDSSISEQKEKEAIVNELEENSLNNFDKEDFINKNKVNSDLDEDINLDEKTLINEDEEYQSIVSDYEIIEEDMKSIEKDLEEIGKQVIIKKTSESDKNAIESYYSNKKEIISNISITKLDENDIQVFDEKSLIDTIIEVIKEFFSFKKYREGDLVLHHHFGIGKIIGTEDILKISFINDQIEEIIEFEYDKNNKIPELDLFKAPKDEDERQYYYNYKRDIPKGLRDVITKVKMNLPDIACHWNIFLRSEELSEKYEFIAISDKLHIFGKDKEEFNNQLLKDLLEDLEIDIKYHEITDYMSVNSILLKSKIKGIMPSEKISLIDERIVNNNIKDYNEREHYRVN